MSDLREPLSDSEYDQLSYMLDKLTSKRAMNLEMLDGFFTALVCSPDMVPPSEHLREVCGGEMGGEAFGDIEELQGLLDLVMRHWNTVVHSLSTEEAFLPLLVEGHNGIAHANDWAKGFMRGSQLRPSAWAELFEDEEHGGLLVPILALAHEHDPDPEMRPYKEPMSEERREQLIMGVAESVPGIYRYFAPHRRSATRVAREGSAHRRATKVGRNEPCPCGSGKKFKKCCGAATLH